jgi:hypothetical protein
MVGLILSEAIAEVLTTEFALMTLLRLILKLQFKTYIEKMSMNLGLEEISVQ